MIPFNKPFLTGKETIYIEKAVQSGKLSGNGIFTQKCQEFFEEKYGFKKCLLTTSCTDALEMCAMLINCKEDDEIIVPSYTFVSSALAFVRQGAKIIFADSMPGHPNIDVNKLEALITSKTKAIVVVHYAGIAVDMDVVMELSKKYNLFVIEDAAQAIDSYYKGKPLGAIGHLSAFSFHETKNIISGEGGMLAINDDRFIERAEVIWEKGTNRASFFRGEINKYGWVDIGSSFLPSEVIAAFLWAQIESLDKIQDKRKFLWNKYWEKIASFSDLYDFKLPEIPEYSSNNAHMFYLIFETLEKRVKFQEILNNNKVYPVFHYLSLHKSEYYSDKYFGRELYNSDKFSDTLLRMPLYYDMSENDIDFIINILKNG